MGTNKCNLLKTNLFIGLRENELWFSNLIYWLSESQFHLPKLMIEVSFQVSLFLLWDCYTVAIGIN